jgi:hypothetical protein
LPPVNDMPMNHAGTHFTSEILPSKYVTLTCHSSQKFFINIYNKHLFSRFPTPVRN